MIVFGDHILDVADPFPADRQFIIAKQSDGILIRPMHKIQVDKGPLVDKNEERPSDLFIKVME